MCIELPYKCHGFDNIHDFNINGKINTDVDKWYDLQWGNISKSWEYSLKNLVRNKDLLETKKNFEIEKIKILSKKKN